MSRPRTGGALLARLPDLGVAGGSVYDALGAEAARNARRVLLTRDVRAERTYPALAVAYEMAG